MLPLSPSPSRENGLVWLFKIISGVLMIVILGIHLVVNHLLAPGGLLTYRDVVVYFKNPLVIIMETVFLCCAVFHSLLGMRAIFLDLNPSLRLINWVDRLFLAFGGSVIVYGFWLLLTVSHG